MSALSGLVQAGAAYLFTDGATYTWEGVVRSIAPKVVVLDEAHMAIGWSGYGDPKDLTKGLKRRRARSQTEVMDALPEIVREYVDTNVRRYPDFYREHLGISLLVALWNDGPQLWALHSDQAVFGARNIPYQPLRLHGHLDVEPGTESAIFGRAVNLLDPASFDPAVDGLALLEHQRRQPLDDGHGGQPRFMVGGFAQLTAVSAAGIETRVLRRWPDKVGRKIVPEPEGGRGG